MALNNLVISSMGMMSHSHAMQTISSNIANINTVGYKKEQTLFATQMTQYTNRGTNNSTFSAGVQDRRLVDIAGLISGSGSLYDLAVSGEGFFIVQEGDKQLYSRAGDFQGTSVAPPGVEPEPITYFQPQGDGVTTQLPSPVYLMNGSGFYLSGWNYNPVTKQYGNELEPVVVTPPETYPGSATTKMMIQGNVRSDVNETQKLSFPIYDKDSQAHSMMMHWEPQPNANTWNLKFHVEGGTVTTLPTEIQFNESAQLVQPYPSTTFQVQWDDGTVSSIEVDLSKMTQYATELNAEVLSQDGKPYGELINREWDSSGVLSAYYGNGTKIPICKVALAQVQVPNMMEAVSGNMFEYDARAGELEVVDLEEQVEGRFTGIVGQALEGSNVQLEDEFSYMIVTQRAYSGSAKAFMTGDEMIKEAVAILT